MYKYKNALSKIILFVLIIVFNSNAISMAQSSSSNYKIEEYYFGTGGEVDASSDNYRAQQSTGALGVGTSSSDNYDANTGFNTPAEPFLEMVSTGANLNFGTLDYNTVSSGATQAGACNCSFYIRSYLSSQYTVITLSNPPTNENNNVMQAKSVLGVPSTDPNVEEFGINLVDNSSPDIGANPVNQPDDSFADGRAATGYNTPNNFKYVKGDIIASSPLTSGNQGVGLSEYTISYMMKIKKLTPAGVYTLNNDLVVISTF